jgi:predicted esterase
MCGAPEQACPHFVATTERRGWLICPRAARVCDGGGSTWDYREREQTIERAIDSVRRRFPGEIAQSAGRTLIGFSLGAFVASELAQRVDGPARYSRVLLIGARVTPDVARLKRAGVQRIALAAGKYDMTYAHMAEQARRLARSGLPALFIDLGRIGHRFPEDFAHYLSDALSWLELPVSSTPQS